MLPHIPTGKHTRRVRPGLSPEVSERTRAKCDWPFGGACGFMSCPRHQPAFYSTVSARRSDAY